MSVPEGIGLLDRFFSFPQIHSSSYLKLLSKTNSFHISIIPRHRKGAGLAAGALRVPMDSKLKLEAEFVQALSKESSWADLGPWENESSEWWYLIFFRIRNHLEIMLKPRKSHGKFIYMFLTRSLKSSLQKLCKHSKIIHGPQTQNSCSKMLKQSLRWEKSRIQRVFFTNHHHVSTLNSSATYQSHL